MLSFLIISGAIFLACIGVAIYIVRGERRYGHAREDD